MGGSYRCLSKSLEPKEQPTFYMLCPESKDQCPLV